MKTKLNELEKILEAELLLHEQLLAAARRMNEALKREAVDDVRKANGEYDKCTCQIEAIEEKRLALSDALSAHYGKGSRINLSRLIESLPVIDRGRLPQLRANIRCTALGEIQKANVANRVLLTEALFVITKTFEFIGIASEKFKGYKAQGKKHVSKIARTIINTVV